MKKLLTLLLALGLLCTWATGEEITAAEEEMPIGFEEEPVAYEACEETEEVIAFEEELIPEEAIEEIEAAAAEEQAVSIEEEKELLTSGEWSYDLLDDGTASISRYNGADSIVAIPSSIDGYAVTRIGYSAFESCTALTEIIIPDGVTSIDSKAFYECTGLTEVSISDSVTSIGSAAFYNCTGLKEISIPAVVTNIGSSAFSFCTNLKTVTLYGFAFQWNSSLSSFGNTFAGVSKVILADGIDSIPESAFRDCAGLTEISIPDSVTSIGGLAFLNCTGLAEITIPRNVTSIDRYAFLGCANLKTVTLNGLAFQRDNSHSSSFAGIFSGVSKVILADGINSIPDYTFYNCTGLTKVNIPNSVTNIGGRAFYNCTGLTTISIPDSVISIGSWAFYDCTNLKTVTLNGLAFQNGYSSSFGGAFNSVDEVILAEGIESIPGFTFYGCSSLIDISIPANVTSIGNYAFFDCAGLTKISLPASVTSIGNYAFFDCAGLTKISLPAGVTSIGNYAFYGCTGLAEISIPNSVTEIGDSAFYGCTNLKIVTLNGLAFQKDNRYSSSFCGAFDGVSKVILADSIVEIPDYSFYNCTDLTKISLPDGVTSIGNSAFYCCSGLTEIRIPNSVTSIGDYAYYGCTGLTEISLPDSVTSIGNSAFYCCSGLTEISIPDSVINIGDSAFYGCTGLATVTIPGNVSGFGSSVFANCTSLREASFDDRIRSLTAEYCFRNCTALTTVNWSSRMRTLNATSMFEGCASLTAATYPEKVSDLTAYNMFRNCTGLTEFSLPETATAIASGMFAGCTGLATLGIPDRVSSIGNSAFAGCTGLTAVTLPEAVTGISSNVFADCTALKSVIAVNSSSIGDGAFAGCTLLNSTDFAEVVSIGSKAFADCASLTDFDYSIRSLGSEAFMNTALTGITLLPAFTSAATDAFFGPDESMTIYGYTGSWAEAYAEDYGIRFAALDEPDLGLQAAAAEGGYQTVIVFCNNLNSMLANTYRIFRAKQGSDVYEQLNISFYNYDTSDKGAHDSSMSADTPYTYKVQAVYKATLNGSAYEVLVAEQTIDFTWHSPIGMITEFKTVGIAEGTVAAAWTFDGDADYYVVCYYPENGGDSETITVREKECILNGLEPGKEYCLYAVPYKVFDDGLTSAYNGNYMSWKATASPIPRVTDLKVEGHTNAVSLSWTVNSLGIDGYEVRRATSEDGEYSVLATTASNNSSYIDKSASPSVDVWYTIIAYSDVGGTRYYGEAMQPVLLAAIAPAAVKGISVQSVDTNAARITWDKIDGVSGYQLWWSIDGENFKWVKNCSTNVANKYVLTPGADYWFKVCAYTERDEKKITGDFSEPVKVHNLGTCDNFTVTGKDTNCALLRWDKVPGCTGYQVFRTVAGSGVYTWVKNATTAQVANYSLIPGTTYYYKIRAYIDLPDGKRAYGQYTDGVKVTIQPQVQIMLTGGDGKIEISWDLAEGATGYQVFYTEAGTGGNYTWWKNVSTATVMQTGLKACTDYYYKVRSYVDLPDGTRYYGQLSEAKHAWTK